MSLLNSTNSMIRSTKIHFIIHLNPALCSTSGGAKYQKVGKRKVEGYINLATGRTDWKSPEKYEKTQK